jgi:hypothetical protein
MPLPAIYPAGETEQEYLPWPNNEAHTFPLKCWTRNEHYQVPGSACQPAEVGMFLRDVTEGNMARWKSAEYFDPTR